MPCVEHSGFRSPWWLAGAHRQTLVPALTRRVPSPPWQRERLELPDGDFLDLDWSRTPRRLPGNGRVVVISHGLEGNSRRSYMAGMVQAFNQAGWDAVAWNFRGCSGEPNRSPQAYHSGSSGDLARVVDHVVAAQDGEAQPQVALVGFSLGGNVTLKYLGERGEDRGPIRGAVAFSVPCDLASAAEAMSRRSTRPYLEHFLRTLRSKAAAKVRQFPTDLPAITRAAHWHQVRTFREFDDAFTAPVHGFRDAADYWARCSSRPLLERIRVPTLLVNALDDPFLTPACFPREEAARSPHLWLETPAGGGHVGFRGAGDRDTFWHERRAVDFLAG